MVAWVELGALAAGGEQVFKPGAVKSASDRVLKGTPTAGDTVLGSRPRTNRRRTVPVCFPVSCPARSGAPSARGWHHGATCTLSRAALI